MVIDRFGVRLRSIGPSDLEQLRVWRNLPQIREQMVFRETITPAMQEAWYAALDPTRNHYFVIEIGDAAIGLVDLKDVDPEARTGEWGIYIVDEERGPIAVIKSAVALLDFAFDDLGLEVVRATVLPTNERAIRLNVALGMTHGGGTEAAHTYELRPDRYRAARARLSSVLR
jgi:RimJ/RimL family protein N-acetyltransferase